MSEATLSRRLNGKSPFRLEEVSSIAAALGTSTATLLHAEKRVAA